ncbi:MAG: 4Fe-4S binding protein [Phycisphaeraceae bacterium]|nr:4Fe-4S binding protein [Phycisphaeraceae bacterium]
MRHRWYCRWLCPTGFLCDTVSRKSRPRRLTRFPRMGPILAMVTLLTAATGIPLLGVLDPVVIFHSFWDGCRPQSLWLASLKMTGLLAVVGINIFIPRLWCGKLCPLGGLQDSVTRLRHLLLNRSNPSRSFLPGRRMTLAACTGLGFGLVMNKMPDRKPHLLRPPGALSGNVFSATCIRCGNCGKACPTQIIKPSLNASNWTGLLTPTLSFTSGYCPPECTTCGNICPSGAIKPFSQEEKRSLFVGLAHIQREHCLLAKQKECDRCQFYCAYDAITIHSSDIDFSAWPEVHEDRCVGCGACVAVCPESIITVDPIS